MEHLSASVACVLLQEFVTKKLSLLITSCAEVQPVRWADCGRCLEGLFDTWGAFGRGFVNDLERGGPTPIGARKANLSADALPFAEEVALNEQVGLRMGLWFSEALPFVPLQYILHRSNFVQLSCAYTLCTWQVCM